MKKTFKGYRVVMALLIALLVMSSVPMLALAANEGDQVEITEGSTYDAATSTVSGIKGDTHPHKVKPGVADPAPTCTEGGWMKFECEEEECAKHGIFHRVKVAATGHKWDSEWDYDAATKTYSQPSSSDWGKITNDASCTSGGTAEDFCLVCGATNGKTREVEPTNHVYGPVDKYIVTKDKVEYFNLPANYADKKAELDKEYAKVGITITALPNCQNNGSAVVKCTICGKTAKTYPIEKKSDAHVWSDPNVKKAPTCEADGNGEKVCIVCGKEANVVLPMLTDETREIGTKVKKFITCFKYEVEEYCISCEKNKTKKHAPVVTVKEDRESHVFDTEDPTTINEGKSDNIVLIRKNGKVVGYKVDDCEKAAKVVYNCLQYDTEKAKHDKNESGKCFKEVKIAKSGHKWTPFEVVSTYTKDGEKWYVHYRECEKCNAIQKFASTDESLDDGIKVVKNDAKYELDVTGVKEGAGTAKVTIEGSTVPADLYVRVTWVYELSDGSTFAYSAMAPVDQKAGTAKVGGAMTPNGATLVETQVALTDDADANLSGEFNQLAGAKA